MLGDIIEIAERLWLIEGEMPRDNDRYPDAANVIAYRRDDRLYLIDSGVGPVMRASLERLIEKNRPIREFMLLNSHGHIDHIANNDLMAAVPAVSKHHYLSAPGFQLLDAPRYFTRLYHLMNAYYDTLAGFQAKQFKYRAAGLARDVLAFGVGKKKALSMLIPLGTRKFEPVRPSRDTMETFESLARQRIPLGSVAWTGWVMGATDVLVLEDRGHSPDHMLFYIPEHHFLYTGDATFEFFRVWPDADRNATRNSIAKCVQMVERGQVQLFADAHHHKVMQDPQTVGAFLEKLLGDDETFQRVLAGVIGDHPGLAIPEIYARLGHMRHIPAVRTYLDREFPHAPPTLQAVILLTLLDMGCRCEGPWRRKRFYPV